MLPPAHVKNRILDAASREPSAIRRDAIRQTTLVVVLAAAVDIALLFLLGGMQRGNRSTSFVLATVGGSGLIALVSVWGAFGRGRSMLGRSQPWLWAITVATPIALFAWLLVCDAHYAESVTATPASRIGLRCLALSLGMATWPVALLALVRRERNPTAPVAAGAARGAAVGAVAWLLVALWCPITGPAHVAVGHVVPLLLIGGFGAWIGKRLNGVTVRST